MHLFVGIAVFFWFNLARAVFIIDYEGYKWEINVSVLPSHHLKKICVPQDRLPDDTVGRQAFLDNYFNHGVLASASLKDKEYELSFEYPYIIKDFFIDPLLTSYLPPVFPQLTVCNIPFFWMRSGHYQESFNDNFSLLAWAHFMADHKDKVGPSQKKLAILHLDDHADMMEPLVAEEETGLLNVMTGEIVNFDQPLSVQKAIENGAIPVGAFITPFLYAHQDWTIEIVHVTQRPSKTTGQKLKIQYGTAQDPLLHKKRIFCRTSPCESDARHSYFSTPSLEQALASLEPGCFKFLHIDLDYFNDRYDGDSHWETRSRIFDPPYPAVLEEMKKSFEKCSKISYDNIAVCYSPGFFPAEFWKDASQLSRRAFLPSSS